MEIIIIIINPLTARVAGAPQMILQPVFFPFSPVLHCSLGLAELQACPFADIVFPPLTLSALSSSPSHFALQDGFGQTWWTRNMTISLQFSSLYDRQVFVWSNCLLDLGTGLLVGNMAFVWDVWYLAVVPHFHGLYSSLELMMLQKDQQFSMQLILHKTKCHGQKKKLSLTRRCANYSMLDIGNFVNLMSELELMFGKTALSWS